MSADDAIFNSLDYKNTLSDEGLLIVNHHCGVSLAINSVP